MSAPSKSEIGHNGRSPRHEGGTTRTGENGVGRTTFSDVARAHYHWDVEAGKPDGSPQDARADFDGTLDHFEHDLEEGGRRGRVVEAYWCRKQASAVALVEVRQGEPGRVKRTLKRLRFWWPVPEYRIYRETDWVTDDFPKLANLLHTCDVLEMKARWSLESNHAAVVMSWLMAVEAHVVGFIESQWRRRAAEEPPDGLLIAPERVERVTLAADLRRKQLEAAQAGRLSEQDEFHAEILRELGRIEDYYHQAGMNRARLHYVIAMVLFGIPVVALASVASAAVLGLFGVLDRHDLTVQHFYACAAAGAVGAIISVLLRMTGQGGGFVVDHELGAQSVRILGLLRPVVGAVCGIIVSLLMQTSLVPIDDADLTTEFVVVVAFLAGFSERWTKVVLDGAMRTIEKDPDTEPAGTAAATGTTAAPGTAATKTVTTKR